MAKAILGLSKKW